MIYRIDYMSDLGHRARLYRKNADQVRYTAHRLVYGMLEGEGLRDRPIAPKLVSQCEAWKAGDLVMRLREDLPKRVFIQATGYKSLSEARNTAPEFDLS